MLSKKSHEYLIRFNHKYIVIVELLISSIQNLFRVFRYWCGVFVYILCQGKISYKQINKIIKSEHVIINNKHGIKS